MDAELPVPDFDGDVLDFGEVGDAGVVEQDVEAAMCFEHRVDDLGPVLFRCDVEMHVACVMALGAQGGGGAFAEVVSDVGDEDLGAFADEQVGGGAAEAHGLGFEGGGGAGEEGYFLV